MYAVVRLAAVLCSPALCAVALYLSVSVFTTAEAGQDHTSCVAVVPSSHLLHEIVVCEPSSTLEVQLPLQLQLTNQKIAYTA